MRFDPNANPPAYVTDGDEEDLRIEKGELVRLRIVGTRIDSTEIVSFLRLFMGVVCNWHH